jgi:hypothetical protein
MQVVICIHEKQTHLFTGYYYTDFKKNNKDITNLNLADFKKMIKVLQC